MTRPRLLDLFCCEGGAGWGYRDAGFEVVGVDIVDQPDYPFEFHRADALEVLRDWPLDRFDVIHASPPCPAYSTMTNRRPSTQPMLIPQVRDLLAGTGKPYVIENVAGARRHMRNPLLLHGGHFGLNVFRPRLFESNALLFAPAPARPPRNAAAVYGKNDGRRIWTRVDGTELRCASLDDAREAMGMPWATWNGVREAIPPAYTEHIGRQLLEHIKAAA